MKELSLEKMEVIQGGNSEFSTAVMCGIAAVWACFIFTAPLAGAAGAACIVGLYANYGDMPRN